MTRIKTIGLCLVSAFAFSAFGIVSAASAEIDPAPEHGICKAKAGAGVFTEADCETEGAKAGKGKEFVWVPQKTAAYTSTTGGATLKSFTPEGVELPPVECKSSKGAGKVTATGSEKTIVTFSECTSAGEKCTGGKGAKAGQIKTFELTGTLGIVTDSPGDADVVGEDLVGTGGAGKNLSSEFKCGANSISTTGSVIGVFSKVEGKPSTTNTLTFAEGAPGHQAIESFEGGPKDTLQTEINGLGGGTFPFPSVEITTATVKGPSGVIRA
jgi:hypothetical protein